MAPQILPGPLKKALELLEADPVHAWTVGELALACGVGRRTLQRYFRHFMDKAPMEVLHDLRLDRARQDLLRTSGRASVTDIAVRCGFNHVGRFAIQYRARYGESPSATLRRRQITPVARPRTLSPLGTLVERPAMAVLPFGLIGAGACRAAGIREEIVAALVRVRWIAVRVSDKTRYQLGGTIRDDGAGRLRITVTLLDAVAGRYLWADHWECACSGVLAFTEVIAARVAGAVQQTLREAEIDRVSRQGQGRLNAWELTMWALPRVLSVEAAAEEIALEWLEQAMESAPQDALPAALAAWCHGLRGAHNFSARPEKEKATAAELARHAARLNAGDPLTDTMLAAAYCLAHDLERAAIYADRALAVDGSSAWAWGRSGWIKAYGGEAAEAIERFQIAQALAPADPLNFLCSVGIAVGHFWEMRYDQSARWFERALAENPSAVWINQHLAPAYAFVGRKDSAQRCAVELAQAFPDLTIAKVKSGLPFRSGFLDRVAEGLEYVGMRAS